MCTGMLPANSNSLISFPICVTLISFSSLIVPVWTQYWKEQWQWVVLSLSWLLKNFSIRDDVVCMFFYIIVFIMVRYITYSLYSLVLPRTFKMKTCCYFQGHFLYQLWWTWDLTFKPICGLLYLLSCRHKTNFTSLG